LLIRHLEHFLVRRVAVFFDTIAVNGLSDYLWQ